MTSVAVLNTVIIVWCCFGVPFEVVAGSCESCGRECKDVCGTKQFRPCCFNYLRKRKVDSPLPVATTDASCQQCGTQCSVFCATKSFIPCCYNYHLEKRKECRSCGNDCYDSCGTRYFRTCCLNYHKKRSVIDPEQPLQFLWVVPNEEFNDKIALGMPASSTSPSVQLQYYQEKSEYENQE